MLVLILFVCFFASSFGHFFLVRQSNFLAATEEQHSHSLWIRMTAAAAEREIPSSTTSYRYRLVGCLLCYDVSRTHIGVVSILPSQRDWARERWNRPLTLMVVRLGRCRLTQVAMRKRNMKFWTNIHGWWIICGSKFNLVNIEYCMGRRCGVVVMA